jgi:hypothetical protein
VFKPFGFQSYSYDAAACIQGLFKAKLRVFATMLLNGHQKSKESKK